MQNQSGGMFVNRGIKFDDLNNVMIIRSADFDSDGDLDLITGISGQPSKVLINNFPIANRSPEPPSSLDWEINDQRIRIFWSRGSDKEPNELTYNVAIGSQTGESDLFACEYDAAFRTPGPGNVGYSQELEIPVPEAGTYYVRVQAIDAVYQRSGWTEELVVVITE